MSSKQFIFLKGHLIHEAIGSAQEGFHSIKSWNFTVSIAKNDLSKAYDRVSWFYICILLLQIGFELPLVKWIMSCVTYISFMVLINGSGSPFFNSSRGLCYGFPLFPYLFFLVVDGLSRVILQQNSCIDSKVLRLEGMFL
jgi:hypothetical protein